MFFIYLNLIVFSKIDRPEKIKLFCKKKNCELESSFADCLNLNKHGIKEKHPSLV
jgi:hypothetical protein